jgi:hypothetical protein
MGDQQAMKPGFGQTAAQKPDAAEVIHTLRITGAGNQGNRTGSMAEPISAAKASFLPRL